MEEKKERFGRKGPNGWQTGAWLSRNKKNTLWVEIGRGGSLPLCLRNSTTTSLLLQIVVISSCIRSCRQTSPWNIPLQPPLQTYPRIISLDNDCRLGIALLTSLGFSLPLFHVPESILNRFFLSVSRCLRSFQHDFSRESVEEGSCGHLFEPEVGVKGVLSLTTIFVSVSQEWRTTCVARLAILSHQMSSYLTTTFSFSRDVFLGKVLSFEFVRSVLFSSSSSPLNK